MAQSEKKCSNQDELPPEQRKVIGMLGGLAWPSSAYAYQSISREANKRLGGDNTVPMCMWSVDLGRLMPDIQAEKWDIVGQALTEGAQRLERAGADFVYMTCNTLHICADVIESGINIPFIHAADSVGKAAQDAGIKRLALLGTRFTMEKEFYRNRLRDRYDLDVVLPRKEDFPVLQNMVFEELVRNDIRPESKREFLRILKEVKDMGAQGAALACTEFGLLVQQSDMLDFPLLDSDVVHSRRALNISLGDEPELFVHAPHAKRIENAASFHRKPG